MLLSTVYLKIFRYSTHVFTIRQKNARKVNVMLHTRARARVYPKVSGLAA